MPVKMENEKLIREFLFGEMPEEKRFEFEERFICDPELFEQIQIVEDELIEKYVREWMNSAERSKFEHHFLNTEKRRKKVEFSQRFINKIQIISVETAVLKKTDEVVSNESVWRKFFGFFVMPKVAMATVFAIVIAGFGSWFLYLNLSDNKTEIAKDNTLVISQTPQPIINSTPENNSNDTPQNSESNKNNLSKNDNLKENPVNEEIPAETPKQSEKETLEVPTTAETPQIKKTTESPVLALFAGTLRSEGKNNTLKLPANSKGATLQLKLETVEYQRYRVEITDAEGNIIFRRKELKANKSRINLFVPAEKLQKGDYMIKLFSGIESVADFQFRVN